MATNCPAFTVPPLGLITGVAAAGRLMVYAAVTTALGLYPGATARTLRVSLLATVTGSVHCVDEEVGVLPSVVQYSTAPAVVSPMVTVCEDL